MLKLNAVFNTGINCSFYVSEFKCSALVPDFRFVCGKRISADVLRDYGLTLVIQLPPHVRYLSAV